MKIIKTLILLLFTCWQVTAQNNIPHLAKKGNATQLMVDNEPFLMIAGEVHNSSASTIDQRGASTFECPCRQGYVGCE